MAKQRVREGIYVEKPKADVYLALLIFTTLATIGAILIMRMAASN